MEKVSQLLTDRQVKPLDAGVWWLEFLIRNEDSNEQLLRPLSVTQSWWVRRQLDVWAFVFLATLIFIIVTLLVTYSVIKLVLRKLCGGGKSTSASKKSGDKRRAKLD